MVIEVKRKENEPVSFFLKRFSEKVKRSNLIDRHKKGAHRDKPRGKRVRKQEALKREVYKKRIEYLKKTGKIKIESRGFR